MGSLRDKSNSGLWFKDRNPLVIAGESSNSLDRREEIDYHEFRLICTVSVADVRVVLSGDPALVLFYPA